LHGLYSQNHSGRLQPTPDALLVIFKELSRPFKHTYIVLDALDECTGTDRNEVLGLIETLVGWGLNNVHLLATSQNESEIKRRLELLNCSQLDLEMALIRRDVQTYVRATLAEDEYLRRWKDKEKRIIEETLIKGANGVHVISSSYQDMKH